MKTSELKEIILDENDLVNYMLQDIYPTDIITENTDEIKKYNELCNLFEYEKIISFDPPDNTGDKYKASIDDNWFMPDEYKQIDIYDYLINCCTTDEQTQRIKMEFEEYKKRDLIPLLKYMKYLVDTMRENKIVWGVGRGSSVASYVLYLIGIHKIDSIKYNLDFKEFFR